MATVPSSARVVVIGAGIVGNSLVYHLARLGWRDIVQLDKGPLPNPGGSTGHASNFIFPVDHSREITDLTLESVRQYKEMDVFTESGGIEVARTEERMQELRRRMSSAQAWGIESHLLTPAEIAEKVPFLDPSVIIGGFWTPSVGVVDSLRAGTIMRERALELDALTTVANVEVTDLVVEKGRITTVRTSGGDIETDTVVIACGVWSPKIARMAGVHIPLTPAVHQMISVGPIPQLADKPGEISYPIVRDMDTFCYERQHGSDMEVGSYAHRPILMAPEDIPSIDQAKLSPTEMPFTEEDFDPQLEQALELMPEILGDEGAEIRYAINGLLSLTPDGAPILGESPEVRGVWSAAAVWIKEGPGVGKTVAEWMTDGNPEIDVHGTDIARFYPHQRTVEHVNARTSEGFNKTYGIIHPAEQWGSNRNVRLAPMHAAQVEQGAFFYETAGWERPHWYASNEALLGEYGERVMPREAEWDARWWSPIINAEHLAMRERAGYVDLSAFSIFDVLGPGALESVQRIAVGQVDFAPGRVIYTPIIDERGGFRADLTIMRLDDEHFRVVTGGAHGNLDRKWFRDHLLPNAWIVDQTNAFTTIGLWGPRARDILGSLTAADISNEAFKFSTCRSLEVASLDVLASRISYVGELGWELYVPIEQGARLWDLVREAGAPHGAVPVGIGVYGTTGRIEKGYRAYGAELDSERTIVEAGMQRPKVKDADFIGREAYLKQRDNEPSAVLCTLTVDDNTSASGVKRYMLGGEPILSADGELLTDGHGHHPYVTTAGSAPSLGKHVLLAYLPPDVASVGTQLQVDYMGERYPVTIGSTDATALFDPANERIRGMNVLVCIKRVPDVSGEVLLSDDGLSVDARHVGFTVSPHEECAVELATQVAESTGGTVTVLTVGPAEAVEQLRTALAVGCTDGVLVEAPADAFGPVDVAHAIADVVRAREDAGTSYGLVLLGNDAADTGDFQVPVRLGYALDRPVVTGASLVAVAGDVVTARADGPEGVDVFELPLPAVVAVMEGGVTPRYPSVVGRMKAKKAPVETIAPAREPRGTGRVRLDLPPRRPSTVEVLGRGPEAAPAVVDKLIEIGVLVP